ncbi:MAG: zinc-ribbon domain-containing protein [Clostridiaceae bacterium]|nr:zinc-ribbon domain-containing protein [Eubacteriales bacterium]
MAYCNNCGAQLDEGAKFCPSCGTVQGGAGPQQNAYSAGAQAAPVLNDAQQNKTMGILAYILFFVPLLAGAHKTSAFVKYHTNQGTVLALFAVALAIVQAILQAILTALFLNSWNSWGVWSLLTTLFSLLWIIPAIFCVMGIINASKGEMKPLPVIGGFHIIK